MYVIIIIRVASSIFILYWRCVKSKCCDDDGVFPGKTSNTTERATTGTTATGTATATVMETAAAAAAEERR